MVGDHPMAHAARVVGVDARRIRDRPDERAHEVDGVIVMRALQHRRDALEPHPGVDRGLRQQHALTARALLELHEHEVPDFDEAVAIRVRRAGRAAGNMVAMVVEDLRAGAARPGVAHRPEIIRGRDADDAAIGKARDLAPQGMGFVVLRIDGDGEPMLRKREFLGHEPPGELDRALLEIIAEGEVAEHLEEGVVARRVADILEVVVLAAGAHAFLRRHRGRKSRLLGSGEDVLELVHPRIGEHQCRVVARHEARGGHDAMPLALEILEKMRSDLVDAGHSQNLAVRARFLKR